MKTIKYLIITAILICALSAAAVVSYSTGTLSNTGVILTGKGALTGVLVITDGTNAATVTVRDAAGGKVIAGPFVVTGASRFGGGTWEIPVRYETSLHLTISGTGASTILYYTHEL